jgi:hypothetical protein
MRSFHLPAKRIRTQFKTQLSKIGNVKIKQHREIVGEIKTLAIRWEAGCWYACFSVEFAPTRLPNSARVPRYRRWTRKKHSLRCRTVGRSRIIATTEQRKRNFVVRNAG